MLAVDTNVVVRFLTRDDARQFARANALIRDNDVYVCVTVLLETEWVLRGAYGYGQARILEALRDLAALPRVSVEDLATVAQAFEWTAGGMEFADALHLARTQDCEAFVSFDRRLARTAKAAGAPAVRPP
ncbi:MAG: type II toxin-antitoxin system VapC family toxin [Alphaproteobacteria bacterium]|nr:type II toxin-antitoxin system VapC family toxin [Alphaproteobacteria bacterium]